MLKIDFIIPVFNESESICELVKRLESVAASISSEFKFDIGYVFVDDGSTDNSFEILQSLTFNTRRICLRKFSRNFGKEAALSAGIEAASASDAVILMDADLQHPPEIALEFVRIWQKDNADSVYAYKDQRRQSEGVLKDLLSRLFFRVINSQARFEIPKNAGDFRLLNKRFMKALLSLPESERFMKGLYGWIGFKQTGIPFTPAARLHGSSHFHTLKLLAMTLDAMTSFSVTPLRIMAITGLFISAMSTLYGLYIIIERLFFMSGGIGIASILTLISFFGGMQMIFLGLLGEYVGKSVLEAKRRPHYIIAEEIIHSGTPENRNENS